MKTSFSLWSGLAVIIVILLAAWAYSHPTVYQPAPEAVSVTDQAADMTDLEAELTTLDADFDSDLDELDKELQGI